MELRDYQQWFRHDILEAMKAGHDSVLAVMPTGGGKRYSIVDLCLLAMQHDRPVLVVTDRRLLVDQMVKECEQHGVRFGVIMADYPRGNPLGIIQIASVQTLQSRFLRPGLGAQFGEGMPDCSLILIDECFTAETEILTTTGPKRIDNVRCGDNVFTAAGIGTVNGTFCTTSRDIYTVRFSDGTSVTCTGNHPFFTERGWTRASALDRGEIAYRVQDLPSLWESVHACEGGGFRSGGEGVAGPGELLSILLKEIQEPNETRRQPGEDAADNERSKAQADQARRERAITALVAASSIARTRGRMGVGGGGGYRNGKGERTSDVLQDRYRKPLQDDRDRAGREDSPNTGETGAGRQEDGFLGGTRVVDISRHQRKSTRTVFNLSVTGHPSYFANGLLVHNCHQSGNRYRQIREFYPEAKCVGFTATPAGPDGKALTPHTFKKMVTGATNTDLISRGFLLPTRVFAPSEPSLKNVSSPGSKEYNQVQLSKAVKECTVAGDIFREYEKFMDRAAVCFAPGIPFARSLVAQFNDRYGPNCARLVEAATKHQEREDIFAAVREGDVKVLASVGVLKEGFDLPALSLGLDLEPNSQLRTYWQKVGRVKRAFPGQTEAVWIDLAGNYWNHIHPDDDPEWPDGTEETTAEIVERKKSDPSEATSICCPACSHIRRGGAVCPNCGHEGVKSLRRVRVGIGELREVRPKDNKKKELTREQRMFRQWQSRLFAAMHSGVTYSQCAAMYRREHGEMPSPKWPGVFPAHSVEWNRRPKSQHTRGSLYSVCRNYLESISNGP